VDDKTEQPAPIQTLPAPAFDENSGLPPASEASSFSFSELLFSRELYRSSAFKLGLAISAIYLFCFSIAWGLSYQFLQDGIANRVDDVLNSRYERLQNIHIVEGQQAIVDLANSGRMSPFVTNGGFQLRDSEGNEIAGTMDIDVDKIGLSKVSGKEMGLPYPGSVRVLVGLLGEDTKIALAHNLDHADDVAKDATKSFIKLFLFSTLLGILGSVYAAWRMHGRIDKITQVMRSVAGGNLAKRLPVNASGDDIDEFSIRVNDALDRLQQNVDGLRQMSSDMAHELKTPLNRLYIKLEGASTKLYEQGVEIEEVNKAMEEAEYINSTFQAILRIAQIEAGARKSAFKPVDLIELVATVGEVYEPVVEEAGNTLQVLLDPSETQYVMGDRELLMQVVVNLIENAIRHCPTGTTVFVDAGEYHGEPWFRIADNGPGVPEEMREKLFQRMFRLEASRTTPGTGLGMTLVKAVADLHCASVALDDHNPGLSITVKFEIESPV